MKVRSEVPKRGFSKRRSVHEEGKKDWLLYSEFEGLTRVNGMGNFR